MLKKFLAVGAVSALTLATVHAQQSPPGAQPSPSPPSAQPSPGATPAPKAGEAPKAAQTPKAGAGTRDIVTAQKPDQMLASKLRGTDVVGADDQKIGDVSDILFEMDGKIVAYVVGVGGFLGIGSKDVALAPSSFQVMPGQDGADPKLKLSMTKDELKQAAAFEPYKAPAPARPVTGSPGGSPAGSPDRPKTQTQ